MPRVRVNKMKQLLCLHYANCQRIRNIWLRCLHHLLLLTTDELYFGDHPQRNFLVYRGVGGQGGGSVEINAHYFELDGHISANGEQPDTTYSTHAGNVIVSDVIVNDRHASTKFCAQRGYNY